MRREFRMEYILVILLILALNLVARDAVPAQKIVLPVDTTRQLPLENLTFNFPKTLRVAVVLSGGGARGFAHIGALKALEEAHIPIHLIVGSSVGSLIGGFYAAGYNADQLKDIVHQIRWQGIFTDETYRRDLFWSQKSNPRRHILEVRFDHGVPYIPTGISAGQKIFDLIYSRLLRANFQAANDFNNLRIPFRAVATDLITGKRVVLKNGDLAEAISGSMAVPLLFSPVEWQGMWLADGGIRDNLPVDVALENGADLTIAVDITSKLRKPEEMRAPWQIADQVTTIMMQEPTENSRKLADVLIQPPLGDHGASDFSGIDSLIRIGYEATRQKIGQIKELMRQRQQDLWGANEYLGKVEEVKILGLNHSELDTLIREMVTQSGYSLYRYDLYKDLHRFYDTGYLSNAYVLLKGDPSGFIVEFHLKENPVIKEIKFHTNRVLPDSVVAAHFKLPVPDLLNYFGLARAIDTLRYLYIRKGYSLARIAKVHFDAGGNRLVVYVDEGIIQKVGILGNKVTKDYVILREFPMKPGEIFQASQAVEGIRNIYSTGLFHRVSLHVVRRDYGNELNIRVKEKKYFMMHLGARGSMERKAQASVGFAEDNFFGRDLKLSLWGTIGDLERKAEFKIYSVRLFNTLLTYRFSMYYQDRWDRFYRNFKRQGDYLTIRRGLQFIIGQQIEKLGSITVELRWDRVHVFSPVPDFPFRDRYHIRSVRLRSVVDKRDKIPFPTRGIYNRWYWESGNRRLLGSSVPYTRFWISLEGYYPVFRNIVYHVRARGGIADQSLPFAEFFKMGGAQDFPGLYERERYGRQTLIFQNDIRFRFRWPLPVDMYLGGTFNAGAVWASTEEPIKPSDFLTSQSIYLAVNSIFGPIRLTYSHLTAKRRLFYLSIGYDF